MRLLFTLLLSTSALAGPSQADAEARRLTEEMTRLTQKGAWSGVERKYEQLVALKKIKVTAESHLQAAHAAQARGDIATAKQRADLALAAASQMPDTLEKASEWFADFEINYGEAKIELSVAFRGEPQIVSRDPVFAPKVSTVLDFASDQLRQNRLFTGYLPIGRFQVGDEEFDIYGGPMVEVFVKPVKGDGPMPVGDDTARSRGERTIVLAARGSGWSPSEWSELAQRVRQALYEADGVLAVDVKEPDSPWVLGTPDNPKLSEHGLTMVDIASKLREALPDSDIVFDTEQIVASPGTDPTAFAGAVVHVTKDGTPLKLEDLATIGRGTPSIGVPADDGKVPRYALTVRTKGSTDAVLMAARAVDGAASLGLTPEEPPADGASPGSP